MNSPLAPARVFQRTPKGQAIAAAPFASQLGQIHQRVLLLVNGFTPIAALDELAHLSGQTIQIAEDLLARGLITECDGAAGRPTRQLAH
jgi:sulfur transfer complex TusBCD TusB component (DsrH family)